MSTIKVCHNCIRKIALLITVPCNSIYGAYVICHSIYICRACTPSIYILSWSQIIFSLSRPTNAKHIYIYIYIYINNNLYTVNTATCFDASASSSGSLNTLRTGDADLRIYITTVQDGWRKSAFLTRACFPCTIHLIMQYIEPVSEWSCWRIFIETWPHSELNFRHRTSSI